VSVRDGFLKALAENEDDTTVRLVYADWLDEHGEHEEADRQRKWPAAKEWLVRFCKDNASSYEPFSYENLIAFGYRVTKDEILAKRIYLDNEAMWQALKAYSQDFWKNWAIVTGHALPPGLEDEGFHRWVCCPHEVYYWFGLPDSNLPEEGTDETY
jgi:uncharacterized protein (TIGR02996 family)